MLLTDWLCIMQSGTTADGRVIEAEWIQQMGGNYSRDLYTANIWLDHDTWYGVYGQVQELKAEQDGDAWKLYARMVPNKRLLELNSQGQGNFFSAEIQFDFGDTNQTYLTGLSVVDKPSSMGTDLLKFNKKQDFNPAVFAGDALQVNWSVDGGDGDQENETEGLIRKLLHVFKTAGGNTAAFEAIDQTPDEDDQPMNDKQFQQFMAAQEATNALLTQVTEGFAAMQPPAPAAADSDGDGVDDAAASAAATDGGVSSDDFAKLQGSVDSLAKQFGQILGERPAGEVPEGDGSVGMVVI